MKEKGHVTCGCIAMIDNVKYLFAGKQKSILPLDLLLHSPNNSLAKTKPWVNEPKYK
jgi:hypothetical protein